MKCEKIGKKSLVVLFFALPPPSRIFSLHSYTDPPSLKKNHHQTMLSLCKWIGNYLIRYTLDRDITDFYFFTNPLLINEASAAAKTTLLHMYQLGIPFFLQVANAAKMSYAKISFLSNIHCAIWFWKNLIFLWGNVLTYVYCIEAIFQIIRQVSLWRACTNGW